MRDKIIKESTNLFLHKGFQGTTIKDITAAVNLTKGAIYWYFKSKDELLDTFIDEWEKSYLNTLIETVDNFAGDFLEKFKKYHKTTTEYALNNRETCVAFTTIAAEMAGNGTMAEAKINSVFERYTEFIARLLELGKKELFLSEDLDVNVAANVIIGMHNGILLQWYMKQNQIDGTQLAKGLKSVILYGITHKANHNKKISQHSQHILRDHGKHIEKINSRIHSHKEEFT